MARCWEQVWPTFRQTHGGWLARHAESSEVLYRLPTKIRETLALRRPHGRHALEAADIAAEKDFDALCSDFFAEGLYRGGPVAYCRLQPPPKLLSAKDLEEMGLDFDKKAMKAVKNKAQDLQLRNKGYIGRLVTDLSFLQARDALRAEWLAVPEDERPVLMPSWAAALISRRPRP